MNAKQFTQFMGKVQELIGSIQKAQETKPAVQVAASAGPTAVPLPPSLELEGDMERNFEFFEESWKFYVSAVGMDTWPEDRNEQKTSILLSVIGRDALKKYANFELTDAEKKNPGLALAAIKRKVVRVRNKYLDWFDFFSVSQNPEESVDDYVCRVKSLAKICKFNALEADMIRYKLVTSIKWVNLRSRLVTMPDLTEAQAVDFCHAEEIAERHPLTEEQQYVTVNRLKRKARRCKFCGEQHDFTKGVCPALGKKCYRCGGKNHFEVVCRAERRKKQKRRSRRQMAYNGSSTDEETETESTSSESGTVGKVSAGSGSIAANLDMCIAGKWQSVQCELDTGASTSLVGRSWLQRMTGQDMNELQPSKYRLRGFGGAEIPVIGQTEIRCRQYGRKYYLVLQVVDVDHGPLLSANVCRTLGYLKFSNKTQFKLPKPADTQRNIYRIEAQHTTSPGVLKVYELTSTQPILIASTPIEMDKIKVFGSTIKVKIKVDLGEVGHSRRMLLLLFHLNQINNPNLYKDTNNLLRIADPYITHGYVLFK
ncbi:tetratricopeptide repeat protein, tpr [Culex quinquefasciatus]|uniref:Tetratricopeptide repeat protein, tpr n=1 Tax=Culex quinquefasciatus TaxID=7176 RepID=B0X8C9_CULQU|nr:tetratricopeptide repeat protein, tpr [Culex quinquefasciatus]|eukprot:XP_001865901.1 tetratricopeptide repeat protein, tpr [Culex quinquefasciatus]